MTGETRWRARVIDVLRGSHVFGQLEEAVLAALVGEVRQASARAGYYAMCAPEVLGGMGMGYLAWYGAWEQIAESCEGRMWLGEATVSHWAMGPSPVLEHLTEEARHRVLPGMMAGETTMCFGMSEPDAGSDAMMMKTRAVADGEGWRLSGSKIWTTNSPYADYCIVFAVTDPEAAAARKGGISAFLVPTNAPGYLVARLEDKMGQHSSDTAQILFENCRVSAANLIGEEGQGLKIALSGLEGGRIGIAAQSVGMARAAFEVALAYSKERVAFGQPIFEHQAVQFRLAEMATQIEAARQLIHHAASLKDAGRPCLKEAAMAKLNASEMAERVCSAAIQTLGGYGYVSDFPVERIYRDVRVCQIYEGTSDVQKILIGRALA